ncbi:hypothetical protein OCU04_009302 [Sclerotinia nivalis]|uniref:Uncharacterized protein n=1 Tax=Sclerotinia nivalis TaxID=352851 RepID=A0A9X0DH69_9HELO|nr:hypothetical protein OCU04_009302 [Sclerotinia nivalis]
MSTSRSNSSISRKRKTPHKTSCNQDNGVVVEEYTGSDTGQYMDSVQEADEPHAGTVDPYTYSESHKVSAASQKSNTGSKASMHQTSDSAGPSK